MASCYTTALFYLVFVIIVVKLLESDVQRLKTAINGIDAELIIDIVTHRTSDELLKISELYKKAHEDDLTEKLSSVLTGNLRIIVLALITPLYDYYAQELKYALAVGIPDEGTAVEILTTIEHSKVMQIEASYERLWRRTVAADCETDRYDIYNLIDDIINPETTVAKNFQKLMDGRRSDDILVIYETYVGIVLNNNASVNVDGVAALTFEQDEYFARKLHNSLARRDERTLIRILVTRCEYDLHIIAKKFEEVNYRSIAARINNKPDDNYRKALLSLVTSRKCAPARRALK